MYLGIATLVFSILIIFNILSLFVPSITRFYLKVSPRHTFMEEYYKGLLELQQEGSKNNEDFIGFAIFTVLAQLIILPFIAAIISLIFPLFLAILFFYLIFKTKFKTKQK